MTAYARIADLLHFPSRVFLLFPIEQIGTDRADAWTTFRNGSGVQSEWMQMSPTKISRPARMPCSFDCDGRPVGFDTMDSGDAGQSAALGRATHIIFWPTDLCTLAAVRMVVCLRGLCAGCIPEGGNVRGRQRNRWNSGCHCRLFVACPPEQGLSRPTARPVGPILKNSNLQSCFRVKVCFSAN